MEPSLSNGIQSFKAEAVPVRRSSVRGDVCRKTRKTISAGTRSCMAAKTVKQLGAKIDFDQKKDFTGLLKMGWALCSVSS